MLQNQLSTFIIDYMNII